MPSNVVYGIDADSQKAIQKLSRVVAKLEESNAKLREMNRAGGQASKSVGGIGMAAQAITAGMAAAYIAVMKVNQALEKQVQLRHEIAGRIESQEAGLKRLVQISETPEEFEAYKGLAQRISQARGIDLTKSLQLVFDAISLGFTQEQTYALSAYKAFSAEVGPLYQAMGGVAAAFGKEAAGGQPRAIMNALLAGAKTSRVDVETLAAQVLAPAQSAKAIGGTAEEVIAAVATMSKALKSPEEAATALGRFADIARKQPQLKGKGVAEIVDIVGGWSEQRVEKTFGTAIRAFKGLGVLLTNAEDFNANLRAVRAAIAETGPQDLVARKIAIAGGAEPIVSITATQQAREARKITEETALGRETMYRERLREIVNEELARSQAGTFTRMMTDFSMWIGERESLNRAVNVAAGWAEEARPEFTDAIQGLQEEIRAWREDMKNRDAQPAPFTVNPYPDR